MVEMVEMNFYFPFALNRIRDLFRSCHPNLTLQSAQSLSHSRAACANPCIIQDYFTKLGALYARLNIISKPMQIFNMGETGISIVHKPGRVFLEIGRRKVWAYNFNLCFSLRFFYATISYLSS